MNDYTSREISPRPPRDEGAQPEKGNNGGVHWPVSSRQEEAKCPVTGIIGDPLSYGGLSSLGGLQLSEGGLRMHTIDI